MYDNEDVEKQERDYMRGLGGASLFSSNGVFFNYDIPHGPVAHLRLTKAGMKSLKKGIGYGQLVRGVDLEEISTEPAVYRSWSVVRRKGGRVDLIMELAQTRG